jgi:hypothetical protein
MLLRILTKLVIVTASAVYADDIASAIYVVLVALLFSN